MSGLDQSPSGPVQGLLNPEQEELMSKVKPVEDTGLKWDGLRRAWKDWDAATERRCRSCLTGKHVAMETWHCAVERRSVLRRLSPLQLDQ